MHSSRTAAVAALGVTVALVAGCGGGGNSDYKNNPRPASPIVITASVSDKGVSAVEGGAGLQSHLRQR